MSHSIIRFFSAALVSQVNGREIIVSIRPEARLCLLNPLWRNTLHKPKGYPDTYPALAQTNAVTASFPDLPNPGIRPYPAFSDDHYVLKEDGRELNALLGHGRRDVGLGGRANSLPPRRELGSTCIAAKIVL